MQPLVLLLGFVCMAGLMGGCFALVIHRRIVGNTVIAERLKLISVPYLPPSRRDERLVNRLPAQMQLLYRLELIYGFDKMRRARYKLPFARLLMLCGLIGTVVAYAADHVVGLVGILAGPAASIAVSRLYYRRCDGRHTQKLFQQFPDALSMIVRAVRVGVPLSGGIGLVAEEAQLPTSMEFRQLTEDISIGRPLPDALKAMAARNQLPEYRFFATALAMQSQTGGGLTETLETLADTIRKRVAARARGHALAAEARASCYVLSALPFVVGLLLCVVNYDYMAVLFRTATGMKLLGAATSSLSIGVFMMRTITNRTLG